MIKAFIIGMIEFRRYNWTTHFDNKDLMMSYEIGRELMHRITFRVFEE